MYLIDGISLANSTYNWSLEDVSEPKISRTRELTDFNSSGRDGTVQVRGRLTTPTLTLVMVTPGNYLDDLEQLCWLGQTLTDDTKPGTALTIEALSVTPNTISSARDYYQVTAVFRAPAVYWRDTATTDYGPTTLTTSGQAVTVFTPSTAPIRDALISVKGSVTGLAVTGSLGTYFSYSPNVPSGTYLTFDASTGHAWTGTTVFAKTTEVTGSIQNGPGPYYLECVGTSNPANLGTALTVTWTAMTAATVTVRGYNAYNL